MRRFVSGALAGEVAPLFKSRFAPGLALPLAKQRAARRADGQNVEKPHCFRLRWSQLNRLPQSIAGWQVSPPGLKRCYSSKFAGFAAR